MKILMQLDRHRVTTRKYLKMLRVEKQGRRVTLRENDIGEFNIGFWAPTTKGSQTLRS